MSRRRGAPAPLLSRSLRRQLQAVGGVVCDLDGTLVLGDRHNHGLLPLPGAVEFVAWLRDRALPFVLFTNGTTRTPQQYARMLRALGFDLTGANIMTPASSAVDVFLRRGHRRVLVLGGAGLKQPLQQAGIEVAPRGDSSRVDAVLVGWFREFTMEDLESAVQAVWDGARLYSCSQSLFFATAQGRALGTSRAITAMIRDLTGCRVGIVGKPSLDALNSAARRLGVARRSLVVIGDDPGLEIAMARRGQCLAIGVHSGIGDGAAFSSLPRDRRPHLVVPGIAELLRLCQNPG